MTEAGSCAGNKPGIPLRTLTRRSDFLACNKGRRQPMPGFVLLVQNRGDEDRSIRLGITVTKKIGGAVIRNRMKRRFRALARQILPLSGIAGADHVLIGRADGVERDYAALAKELEKALTRLKNQAEAKKTAPDSRPAPHFGRGKGPKAHGKPGHKPEVGKDGNGARGKDTTSR